MHKLNAMKRVISKFGAYMNHLAALSKDPFVRSSDKANLRATTKSGSKPRKKGKEKKNKDGSFTLCFEKG